MKKTLLDKITIDAGWYENPFGDRSVILPPEFLKDYNAGLLKAVDGVVDEYYQELDLHRAVVLLELRERVLTKLLGEQDDQTHQV